MPTRFALCAMMLMLIGLTSPAHGQWVERLAKSQMDGDETLTLIARGAPMKDRYGRTTRPSLVIRCSKKEADVYLNADMILDSHWRNDSTEIRLKFDDLQPIPMQSTISTDHQAAFFRYTGTAIEGLLKARRVLVEFTPHQTVAQVATINVRGLDKYLTKLKQHCGLPAES